MGHGKLGTVCPNGRKYPPISAKACRALIRLRRGLSSEETHFYTRVHPLIDRPLSFSVDPHTLTIMSETQELTFADVSVHSGKKVRSHEIFRFRCC